MKKQSNTPETDAAAHHIHELYPSEDDVNDYWTPADFARRMERERDEARRIAGEHRNAAKRAGNCCPFHTWALPWEPTQPNAKDMTRHE